jgi:hypothetical protein
VIKVEKTAMVNWGENQRQTLKDFPFAGTRTFVTCPFMAATNLSALGSMIGNEP